MKRQFLKLVLIALCCGLMSAPIYAQTSDDSHDSVNSQNSQIVVPHSTTHHSSHSNHYTTHSSKKSSQGSDSNSDGVCLSCIGQEE